MNKYVLSCCSTADLKEKYLNEREINYICFHFELDGKQYMDDLGKSILLKDFYDAMRNGALTKTSQVNVDEYEEYFEKFLKEGKDILHLCLSSGISGTLNSAMIAKSNLEEKYKDRKIYIIDSLAAASGYGLLVDKAADLRDSGMSIDELYNWINENKLKVQHWIFTTDLTYLIRGGRIGKAAGMIGGMLGVCPLIEVDTNGKLVTRSKVRTKRKVFKEIVDKMEQNIEEVANDYSQKCYLSHSDCLEDASEVIANIEERFPKLKGKIELLDIGTTIGSHTGPGTIALFYWGKERKE